MHKMPYKHIAAHLKKTELACRLHYHQMSYGTNRRKRTDSVSSASSCTSAVGRRDSTPENTPYAHLSPVPSPPSSPEYTSGKPVCDSNFSQISRTHVPILPKPDTSPTRSLQSTPVDMTKPPRLDTSFTMSQPHKPVEHPGHIDPARLRAIYDAHRNSFWSMIAAEYSRDGAFSGRQLEEAFFRTTLPPTAARAPSPPTPGPSPQDATATMYNPSFNTSIFHTTGNRGFHAINTCTPASTTNANIGVSPRSSVERCAVSALLTVEKEVRPSKEQSV